MKINEKIKNEFHWGTEKEWPHRTQLIAKIIPPHSRVIDLGGGFCHLEKYLEHGEYTSLDIQPWTDKTIVADFNKNQFPELLGLYQFIVCQGILEYINEPEKFLENIRKYGKIMILTFRTARNGTWFQGNMMDFKQLKKALKKTHWEIIMQIKMSPKQRLFYCRQK